MSELHCSEIIKNYLQGASSIIGALALLYGSYRGIRQYKKDLLWKRTELGRKLCKDFIGDKTVTDATQLIIAPRRTLSILRDEQIDDETAKKEIKKSLSSSEVQADDKLYDLALIFEAFLGGLCELEHHRKINLITKETIDSYVGYWLNFLSGRHPYRKGFAKRLQDYALRHGFNDALHLCQECGYAVQNPWDGSAVEISPVSRASSVHP